MRFLGGFCLFFTRVWIVCTEGEALARVRFGSDLISFWDRFWIVCRERMVFQPANLAGCPDPNDHSPLCRRSKSGPKTKQIAPKAHPPNASPSLQRIQKRSAACQFGRPRTRAIRARARAPLNDAKRGLLVYPKMIQKRIKILHFCLSARAVHLC